MHPALTPFALETFIASLATSGKYLIGSGCSFVLANSLPEEDGLIRAASAITGWALAIVCIFYLSKAVRFLYEKLEQKDSVIAKLHEAAEEKADLQRKEILEELRNLNNAKNNYPTCPP